MFNPLVKVHKPSKNWHDLSYTSLITSNFGILQLVLAKHFFTGEELKVGLEHLIKLSPMLAPVFQKYDIRFDSFVVPDRLVFKDAYNFYKGGKDGNTDIPAPCVPIGLVYNAVLYSQFYGGFFDKDKALNENMLSGTLIDHLNLPTFDYLFSLDWYQKCGIASVEVAESVIEGMELYLSHLVGVSFDISKSDEYPFYNGSSELQLLRQYHSLIVCCITGSMLDKNSQPVQISLLPFLSYEFIWSEYYRNQFVQDNSQLDYGLAVDDPDIDIRAPFWLSPSFDSVVDYFDNENYTQLFYNVNSDEETEYLSLIVNVDSLAVLLTSSGYYDGESSYSTIWKWFNNLYMDSSTEVFSNGMKKYTYVKANSVIVPIYHFMQACCNAFGVKNVNFAKDYFTSASLDSQLGPVVRIPLGDLTPIFSGASGAGVQAAYAKNGKPIQVQGAAHMEGTLSVPESQFGTIPELREASVLQRVMEKLALAGNRPLEWFKVFFGMAPSDERLQRPQFLGRQKSWLNIAEVTQTSMSVEESGQPLGDSAGTGRSVNTYGLFSVRIDEPSYVLVTMSIIPKQAYFQGIPYELSKTDRFDFLLPDFQSVGMRAIDKNELFAGGSGIFGFTDRYNEYKCSFDEIHGDFRNSLAFWHSSRIFGNTPGLNDQFVAAKDYSGMNRIFAVTDNMTSHVLGLLHFNISALRPLEIYPNYSL